MRFIADLNELSRNAHAIPSPTHASFQDVGNAELASDLPHAFVRRAILHGGSSSDYSQALRTDSRELRNHFLSDAVAEVVVLLVTTEVLKRQHSQHHSLRLPCGRGPRVFRDSCCEN